MIYIHNIYIKMKNEPDEKYILVARCEDEEMVMELVDFISTEDVDIYVKVEAI